jgi:hypothetical protein
MTATRRGPPETREAPWSKTQVPERDSTRETATSPGWSGCSAVRRAWPATASTADGSLPACRSPSGRAASQRSTPEVADSTSPSWDRTRRPGASGPSGSVASPTSSARRAPSASEGATRPTKASSASSNCGWPGSRYSPRAPHTSPAGVRRAAISSWSPPRVMLKCQRGLLVGSPPVASCRVEIPRRERATSASLLTSSW